MKNTDNDQLRAQLISTLWSLKAAISKHPNAIRGLGYVHFNTLIKDEAYRLSILQAATASSIDEIRELALVALKNHLPGPLAKNTIDEASSKAVMTSMAESTQTQPEKKRSFSLWLKSVLLFVLMGGMTTAAISGWLWNSDIEVVEAAINESQTWSADKKYILNGLIFVESGVTLTIEPGTQITGAPGSALIVTRDAKINAQGQKNAPIVMTSSQTVGERQRGDWGGLVLLGNAPVNSGTGHIEGIEKGDPRGGYGGMDDTDSCGVLKYVRIEFAGYEISQDNELNGLTLGGCGSGTIINHVQVHMGLDDGVEVFGGTVNLKHILISRPGDDGLDWDRGWQGNGQFIIVHQGPDDGDNAIEADNDKANPDALPRSRPTLSNISLVGSGNNTIAQRGLLLRRGTGGDLRNVLITGFSTEAFDIGDAATAALTGSGELKAHGWVIQNNDMRYFADELDGQDDDLGFSEQDWILQAGNTLTPREVIVFAITPGQRPDFAPLPNSAATKIHVPVPQGEFWDEGANFAGAIRPGARVSWLDGWTAYPLN